MIDTTSQDMNGNQDLALLTLEETAGLLKVDATTVGRMINRGELAGVKFGRSVRIRRQDLEEFIKSHLEGLG